MKKKVLIGSTIIFIAILSLVFIYNNIPQSIIKGLSFGKVNEFDLEETIDYSEVGENAIISSAIITKRTTGVGPFDENNEPGNDSSEDNDIVRSFDQITWTIENTMSLKDTATVENFKGGVINIKATLPEECENVVKWDVDSMAWAENAIVSADGTTFTAKYSMTETEITVPGKQTLVLVLKVLGASNGTEIIPTFSINLEGNDTQDAYNITDEIVTVSAAPNYNIQLVRNTSLSNKITVDYGEGNTKGRMYGYGLILQLYNNNSSKGLKGIEYPNGEIKFDINLKLTRSMLGSTSLEDITKECTPILWNYKVNQNTTTGVIANRNMKIVNNLSQYDRNIPYGILTSDRTKSTYNSGNIEMIQNNETITTTISNYDFDNIFPTYPAYTTATTTPIYGDNIGCFSIGYFQIFVPDNEASTIEDRNYYLTVSDSNFSAQSISGKETKTQQVTSDDSITVQHVLYRPGSYDQSLYLERDGGSGYISTSHETGDAKATTGQIFELWDKFSLGTTNDYDVYSGVKFIKFDGDAVEPLLFSNGNKYKTNAFGGNMTFNVWYITKKDGTNWESQTEMNSANIEDMLFFENIEDIPEGYICIGEYFESNNNGNIAVATGDNNTVRIRLKIKETAEIGKTYGFTAVTKMWLDYVDRNLYSITKQNFDEWPTYTWSSGNRNYIKTEYNENGEIVEGTHNGGWRYGQSVLIVGSNLSITKTTIDESTNEKKVNYDMSKNEYNVTYKLTPILPGNTYSNIKITNVTLQVKDTLPKGLTYVPGSCEYGEPEITENSNGSTTLVWYIYNCTVGDSITPITYKAHINEESANGTQYETTAVVSEVIGEDGISKIGNSEITNRTATTSIQIINLSSYSLYKTTETPVIEINGTIHYKITAINKTDDSITDFQLLDILPYNGDSRGTSYNGTYTVDKIEITQTDTPTGNAINPDNLKLYITSNESVRTGVTAKDENLGTTSIWQEGTPGNTINSALTAYAVVGEVLARERVEIDIYLKTNGNKPYDNYKNSATAQTNKETEVMETSIITVQDIKRNLEGQVWFDSNKDGVINEGEEYLEGVKVSLLDANGKEAVDIHGNKIENKLTDANGYYLFEDMPRGNYIVQVDWSDSLSTIYTETELTSKGVGANKEINSKFNSDGTTDTITSLNSIESPVITESNVNAGITYKDTSVLVHHYIEGTTTKLSEDVTIEGKITDSYKTEVAKDIPEYYELVSMPTNATGTMKLNQIEVTYYYRLKKYSYTVNYLEKDADTDNKNNTVLHTPKTVTEITYGTQINSVNEKIEITGYNYDSLDKSIITIGTGENIINLYYTKRTDIKYTVEYYYNGVIDNTKTDRFTATYQDKITTYTDKVITGYRLMTTEEGTKEGLTGIKDGVVGLPLTIGADETKNVIKVYYVIDENQTKDLSYTVEYYKDNIKVDADTQIVETTVQLLQPDTLTVDKTAINIIDKYEGYRLEKTEPGVIPDTIETSSTIKVYYVKRSDLSYTVKYLEQDTNKELVASKIVENQTFESTVTEQAIDINGYNKVAPIEKSIQIAVSGNEIAFYYTKRTDLSYTVKYLEKDTNIELAPEKIVGNQIFESTVKENAIEINGYDKVDPTEKSIQIAVTGNEIIFYYTKRVDLSYKVNYLLKDNDEDNSNNTVLHEQKIVNNQRFKDEIITSNEVIAIYGYKLDSIDKEILTIETTENVINIYYVIDEAQTKDLSYTVEYYINEEKQEDDTVVVTETVQVLKPDTLPMKQELIDDNKYTGYEIDRAKEIPEIVNNGGVVEIHYKNKIFGYKVKYYFNGYVDEALTEEKSAKYLDVIGTYEDKIKEGYIFDEVQNCPLTVTEKEEKNIIKVYYKTDQSAIKELTYKIFYYKDGVIVDRISVTRKIQVLLPNEVAVDKNLIDKNKYKDADFIKTDPTEIPSYVKNGDIISVYYETKTSQVVAKYVDKITGQSIIDDISQEGKVGDTYTLEPKEIEGYTLIESPELTGTITEEAQEKVFYYAKNAEVKVKYLEKNTDEILSEEQILQGYEGKEYTTEQKEIENYKLIETVGTPSGTMQAGTQEVIYYYAQKTKVTVNHIDIISGETLETETIDGKVGDEYTTSSKDFEGYVLVDELPENATGVMVKDEIIVNYYYKHVSAGVVEKHIDKITGEILDNTIYEGNEGDEYTTSPKDFEGYDLEETLLPENSQGTMTKELIEVKYYYVRKSQVKVKYLDKNTLEEIATAEIIEGHEEDSYSTTSKEIEGYYLVESMLPENATGTMTKDEIIVTYYYAKKSAGVIEKHINEKTEEILEEKLHEGLEGDNYKTSSKEFEGYDLDISKLPENAEGKMTTELIEVNYYYLRKAQVKVEYIDELTGEEIENTTQYIYGYEGDSYITNSKDIKGYVLDEEKLPENSKGIMTVTVNEDGTVTSEIVVKYYYKKISAGVLEKHIDIKTNDVLEEKFHTGNVGDSYKINSKEYEEYDLVEKDAEGNSKLPEKAEGTMTEELIEVNYYYIRKATVRVEYVDTENGKKVSEDTIIEGHEDDEYKTTPKEIKDYTLNKDKLPENSEGTMKVVRSEYFVDEVKTETVVTYYYDKVKKPSENKNDNTNKPDNKPNNTNSSDTENNDNTSSNNNQKDNNSDGKSQTIIITTDNSSNSSTSQSNKTTMPSTGDIIPVIAIATIMLVAIANIVQIIINKRKKNK